MKLPHALQINLTVVVKKRMLLHFFKVVQQQTIGKVGNSVVLWAEFLSATVKSDSIKKVMSRVCLW